MVRRYVAPILRLLLAIFIMIVPLLLAAIAQADPAPPHALVALRSVVLGDTPSERWPRGARLPGSVPATLVERRGDRMLVESAGPSGPVRGWADASAFLLLDDPSESADRLLDRARLSANQGDRPVLTIAFLSEVLRRDPARVEAWRLLGATGEKLAGTSRPGPDGKPPLPASLAARWGLLLVATPDGGGYRYDGEAYRRLIALAPPDDVAEDARVRLVTRCGPVVDPGSPADAAAIRTRERDLGEFLASFPSSARRVPLLLERARLLSVLAERSVRSGRLDEAQTSREAAIEAASEVSSTAPDAARRRAADRLIARLTKSFPKKTVSDKSVVAANGTRAAFVGRAGGTVLQVTRTDGKDAIQPYAVSGPDPDSLAFDPTGTKLVWDESPEPGRRRTRLLDLRRARLVEPAAAAEPELLTAAPGKDPSAGADRYTTSLGFSPDGRSLLVVFEGFTADGVRIARRHLLCDVEGKRPPVLVARPFSAPGKVDWDRLAADPERLSG